MPDVSPTVSPTKSFRDLLRTATAEAHLSLESRLDILSRLSERVARLETMIRFRTMHAAAEERLAPIVGALDGLAYSQRRKTGLLDADIRVLGGSAAASPPHSLFTVRSKGEALGLLYVLEGSTLGGRMIFREMQGRGISSEGLSFFDAYGSDTGLKWREFLVVLEREAERGGAEMRDEIVSGAISAFRQIEAWLCGEAVAA